MNLMNLDWDFLIILDACRYDYFSFIYNSYFDGDFSTIWSLGSCTPEWLKNTFKKYYDDLIYVSSNIYINSCRELEGFEGRKHFYKVIDVWYKHWNKQLGTVHPFHTTLEALKVIQRYPNKRVIIHYIQPHAPYIHPAFRLEKATAFPKTIIHNQKIIGRRNIFRYYLALERRFIRLGIPNGICWSFRELFGFPNNNLVYLYKRKLGYIKLRVAYYSNLKIVLNYVAALVNFLSKLGNKKIIITADHGEMLGEREWFAHPCGKNFRLLRQVPFLVVKRPRYTPRRLITRLRLSLKTEGLKEKLERRT